MTFTLSLPPQVLAAMSAHLVTMETLVRWGVSVNRVSATTTLTCWTQSLATLKPGSVCAACTTARAPPARAANWVTTATRYCRTAEVSTWGYWVTITTILFDLREWIIEKSY